MKKILSIGVVVAAALASGAVCAQSSSVTLFGTVDVSGKYVKNDGSERRYSLSQDGINRSQLGFRGIEDLGGGLRAGFTLISTVNPDTGTTAPKFWNRRSTVSLFSPWGELRLGRDYTPTFWANTIFDPFGGVGVADPYNVARNFQGFTVPGATGGSVAAVNTFVRADNSIGYFLPSTLGGIYGQAMVAAAEPGSATNLGRYVGGRLGFAAGPIDVAAAYGQTRAALAGEPKVEVWNVAGSYDLQFVKLFAQFHHEKNEVPVIDVREKRYVGGVSVPIGQGEIHASYTFSQGSPGPDARQYGLGYQYNLSKRTAIYGTAALINNGGSTANGANFSTSYGTVINALPTRGGDSTGAEIGVRHLF